VGRCVEQPVALPDSRDRWEAIWQLRHELSEIAHSHPVGPSAFSAEDTSTMAALDLALGRKLRYSVVAPKAMIVRADDRNVRSESRAMVGWPVAARVGDEGKAVTDDGVEHHVPGTVG